MSVYLHIGFPGGSIVRNPRVNAGDTGLITELERSPGEGYCNPLQYSCLANPMVYPWSLEGYRSLEGYSPWIEKDCHMTEQLNNSSSSKREGKEVQ